MIFINHDDLRSLECFEECVNDGLFVSDDLEDLKYADMIYLGQKGLDRKNILFCNKESVFIDEERIENMKNKTVMTLLYNEYMEELSNQYHFHYIALMNEDEFVKENSILTAEGLIGYLINHRIYPLYNTHVLVLGYGKCGKAIVECLKGFQMNLNIFSKNLEENLYNIQVYSCLDDIDFSKIDIVLNTIPEVIINDKYIDQLKDNVMIVDIASFPYGIDHHYALKKGMNSIILPSIPNKYAYKYAGQMIFNKIRERLLC